MACKICGQPVKPGEAYCEVCRPTEMMPSDGLSSQGTEILEARSESAMPRIIRDRFEVIKRLGSGGMGEVFLCNDIVLKRQVALKRTASRDASEAKESERLMREAQAASQLDHENICTIYEVFQEGEFSYIVMQYVDGVDLESLKQSGSMSLRKILELGIQIASAMKEAHAKGIIHRDLKPSNVMVNSRGVVKILDFGLAKFKGDVFCGSEATHLTQAGMVLGTLPFMSPEQVKGVDVDHRSDVFSFGALLLDLIEGRSPFDSAIKAEIPAKVLYKEVQFSHRVPAPLRPVLEKALHKDPDMRHDGFGPLLQDLDGILHDVRVLRGESVASGDAVDDERRNQLKPFLGESSDQNELGDLVQAVRRERTSTELISGIRRPRMIGLGFAFMTLIALGLAAFLFWPLGGDSEPDGPVFVALKSWENNTEHVSLHEQVRYLLKMALESRQGICVVDENGNMDKTTGVDFEVRGSLGHGGSYATDVELIDVKRGSSRVIPMVGADLDSYLNAQLDFIAREISQSIQSESELIPVASMFGHDWERFETFFDGLAHHRRFEVQEATSAFMAAENVPARHYFLADLWFFNGQPDKARAQLALLQDRDDQLGCWLDWKSRALAARIRFDLNEELQYLEKLRAAFPLHKEILYELGEAYFHHGHPEQARQYYDRALELDPGYSKAINHLGYCLAYLGEHRLALHALQEYRRFDGSANSYDSLGDGYFFAGEYDLARQFKEAAIRDDEQGLPWARLSLADIAMILGQDDVAESHLNRYVELGSEADDPSQQAFGLAKLAFLCLQRGHELDRAHQYVNRALTIHDTTDIWDNTADTHWIAGLIALARQDDETAQIHRDALFHMVHHYSLSEQNFHPVLKYALHIDALLLERRGELESSRNQFQTLLDMAPQLSYWTTYFHRQFFHHEFVKFLRRQDECERAEAEARQCLAYNENYVPCMVDLAEMLAKDDPQASAELCRRVEGLIHGGTSPRIRTRLKSLRGPTH